MCAPPGYEMIVSDDRLRVLLFVSRRVTLRTAFHGCGVGRTDTQLQQHGEASCRRYQLTRDVPSLDHDPVNLYGKACAHRHTKQYMYIGQTR